MNQRKAMAGLCYDILVEAIGYAEVKEETDYYQHALNLMKYLAETEEIGVKENEQSNHHG